MTEMDTVGMMTKDKPDFMAMGADASMFSKYSDQLQWLGLQFKETKVIDYTDDGCIAFRKYPGSSEMFQYYQIISWQFLLAYFISISLLSLFIIRNMYRLKKLAETYLDLFSLTFSKCLPSSLEKCDHITRLVLGPFLMLLLFATITFCNLILDDKVKKIQDMVIDSWDDLAMREDLEIVGVQNDFVTEFVEKDNEMARNFAKRFKEISIDMFMKEPFLVKMAMNILNGKAVFLKNRLFLIFILMRMARFIKDKNPDFLDHIHVSRYGSTSIHFFIPSFHYPDHPVYRDMNKVLVYET